MFSKLFRRLCASIVLTTSLLSAAPTLHLVGDSTVKNSTKGQEGWGSQIPGLFQTGPGKLTILNHSIGGRSSRSFIREGRWDKVLEALHPGDFLLLQFGHYDNGPIFSEKARASLKGVGAETKEVTIKETGEKETVQSFGGYLRHYARTAQDKGVTVILCSLIPRNIWTKGTVNRDTATYVDWTKQAAEQTKAEFLNLNAVVADTYDKLGEEKVKELFTSADHTHTSPAGAAHNAACVVAGLRAIPAAAPLVALLKEPQAK